MVVEKLRARSGDHILGRWGIERLVWLCRCAMRKRGRLRWL